MFLSIKKAFLKMLLKFIRELSYILDEPRVQPTNRFKHGVKKMINLQKGEVLDLKKDLPNLKKIKVCAGWDQVDEDVSLDADLSAFILQNGVLKSDIVYFNRLESQGVKHFGDNLTGEGEGDDEIISVDLSELGDDVTSVVFLLNIFKAVERNQNLTCLKSAFVRIVDAETNNEIGRYEFTGSDSAQDALVFCSVSKAGEFTAIGKEQKGTLIDLAEQYK